MHTWLRRSLWDQVPRDHRQSPEGLRRRQLVTLTFLLLGAVVLGWSLRIDPGSTLFYPATLALAVVWTVGAFASGPLHLGRIMHPEGPRRPVVTPVLLGLLLAGVFVLGGLLVREIPALDRQVRWVLEHADQGSGPLILLITVVNGIAEELFFRGAVYAASTRRPVAVSAVAYTLATLATGNVMLTFAAVLLGIVVGLQRRASGGILAPILTHVTWSATMLVALPLVFGVRGPRPGGRGAGRVGWPVTRGGRTTGRRSAPDPACSSRCRLADRAGVPLGYRPVAVDRAAVGHLVDPTAGRSLFAVPTWCSGSPAARGAGEGSVLAALHPTLVPRRHGPADCWRPSSLRRSPAGGGWPDGDEWRHSTLGRLGARARRAVPLAPRHVGSTWSRSDPGWTGARIEPPAAASPTRALPSPTCSSATERRPRSLGGLRQSRPMSSSARRTASA
ncbi:lysostaphin resistance A-like protein [Nocardioides sp.]|uniref:CPBP family intramembrane glutamic endopeptidase n=1 Tax=Nocardioides sp. TaxID=35761 RepID=UPI0035283C83